MSRETRKTTDFARRWGAFVVRFRWAVIAACLIATGAAAYGGQFIVFSNSYRAMFGKDNPQLKAFDTVQNIFTKNDNILFVVTARDGRVFSRETLGAIEKLTGLAWKIPYSRRVDSITNFQFSRAVGDELIVADLIKGAAKMSDADLRARRKDALGEPLLVGRLITRKTDVTGVNVTLQLPENALAAIPEAMTFARKLAAGIEAEYPGIRVRLTGGVALSNAFPEASLGDIRTLIPIMLGIVLLTMLVMVRSVAGTGGTVLVIGFSVVTAMGLAGYAGVELTPPSAIAPTIIMTLAVADSIHLLVGMFREMRLGRGRHDAIVESIRVNLMPIALTSVTTAIGFLSMNMSDAPPLHDLGNITAAGVTAALVYSATFLPALMAVLPIQVRARRNGRATPMDRLAEFVIRQRRALLWGTAAVMVGLFAFIPRIELNDEFVKYFDRSVGFRADTDYSMKHLTGIYVVEIAVSSKASRGISAPVFLGALDRFSAWLRAQPEVVHVNTLTDTMKRLNRNMHADDPSWYRLPGDQKLAAQYLLLYEMSLPFGLDLNDQINVDKSATRLVATLKDVTAVTMRGFEARVNAWSRANLPASMASQATGMSLMFAHISERNINGMLRGTILALLLISGLLILALRSLKIGLISLVPNLAPAGMAFGAWGLLVGRVNMAAAVLAAVTLGIVVDNTIHFLSKYLRARRERGASIEEAVRYAFSTVGMALVTMNMVLMAGFLVLANSSFGVNATMGLMTAVTIGIALAVDFVFLPPLLMKLETRKDDPHHVAKPKEPATA